VKSDRTVLVTGVGGGIGSATARVFHEAGWRVLGADVRPARLPVLDDFVEADIGNEAGVQAVLALLKPEERGAVHALVNNAGHQVCAPLWETTLEDWQGVFAVNVTAPFLLMRGALPWLRAAGAGSVVNVASIHARATSANIAAYAASKGALDALTRAAAIDLAPLGVRVNAVLPGAVDTTMLRAGLERTGLSEQAAFSRLSQNHLMKRVGEPDDIARMILFLADPALSGFLLGQSFVVDGGVSIRLSTETT
jgi:NAD(P)-dependent dehydrogenase (short-subunit alcohol dehydrogenase family)